MEHIIPTNPFDDLPNEIIEYIFTFFPNVRTLLIASQVNLIFYRLAKSNRLWYFHASRDFKINLNLNFISQRDWKKIYLKCYEDNIRNQISLLSAKKYNLEIFQSVRDAEIKMKRRSLEKN